MISTIKRGLNLLTYKIHNLKKRSPHWHTLQKHFLEKYPTCAACGDNSKLNVHHKLPFHIDPALELDENNLITLCMGKNECHFRIGHNGTSWKNFNPNVKEDAAFILENLGNIEKIALDIKNRAKKI